MKKLIWIGEGCWFSDSLLYFKEQDFDITVVQTQKNFIWKSAYDLFSKLGANIVKNSPKTLQKLQQLIDSNTIIIGGGTFMNCQKEYHAPSILPTGLEELDILYKLSAYNYKHKKGAKVFRYFNGETGFGSQKLIDIFTQKIKYTDVLIFDNDQLKDFVMANVPTIKNKKIILGWIETPLKRFVYNNQGKIKKRIISLGRFLCSYPKRELDLSCVRFFPLKKINLIDRLRGRKLSYSLAGASPSLKRLYKDRKLFYKWEGESAFGLSHMYDVFSGSINDYKKHKDFYFSLFGQTMPHNVCSTHETYYQFCNNVNKDICYLMNGIIPLISHTEHNVYKEMINKKMAILIKKPEDISNVLKMSNKEIQEYRDNIYKNRDLFTFDHVGEMIVKELNN